MDSRRFLEVIINIYIYNMAEITKELGRIPVSRGDYQSTTEYYKDNIVQYKRGSYQVVSESPIIGVPPINDKNIVNPGWTLFAGTLDAQDVVNQIKEQEIKSIQAIAAREAEILAKSDAAEVSFNNIGTSFSGTNVQDALEETDGKLSELESEVIYDVTANNGGTTFPSLSALLSSENLSTLIPTSVRHGGMSIRFVQSSDNKYVQARCMAQDFTTNVTQWQGVDNVPTAGSDNLVKSGGIANLSTNFILKGKGNTGVFIKQYYVKAGYSYLITIKNPNLFLEGNINKFEILYNDGENHFVYRVQSGVPQHSYFLTIPDNVNVDHIQIWAKIQEDKEVYFTIQEQNTEIGGLKEIENKAHEYTDSVGHFLFNKNESTDVTGGNIMKGFISGHTYKFSIINFDEFKDVLPAGSIDVFAIVSKNVNDLSERVVIVPDQTKAGLKREYIATIPSDYNGNNVDEWACYVSSKGDTGFELKVSFEDVTDFIATETGIDTCDKQMYAFIIVSEGILKESVTKGNKTLIYKVNGGDRINANFFQYPDTVAIGYSATMPEIGDSITTIKVGQEGTTDYNYAVINDGYILVTYVVNTPISINILRYINSDDIVKSIKEEKSRIDTLNNNVDSINTIIEQANNRPMIQFMNIEASAANGKEDWTGNQIIENIYEPLRLAHPEYIKRRSLGKDASGLYDVWLYELNNNVEEWFNLDFSERFISNEDGNVKLPGTDGLTLKQTAIKKELFDNCLSGYANVYTVADYTVRKLSLCSFEVVQYSGVDFYLFTATDNIKITGDNNSVTMYGSTKVNTFDQHIMIISGTHGDEVAGYLGTALAIEYLVNHHADNPVLDYIYNHVKISLIPVYNIWGSNQTSKVRTNSDGVNLNRYGDILATEQVLLTNYVQSVKDELSFFADLHTSELWLNYGYVYAIMNKHSVYAPAIVSTASYLCKKWFPNSPAYNWNIGSAGFTYGSEYVKQHYNVEGITVEFCGYDLMFFGNCQRWDAKYMSYVVNNYLNFMIALSAMRTKNNSKNIIENPFFEHITMT